MIIEQPNQSPSKRQRWELFGLYLVPGAALRTRQLQLSDEFDADVKSFVSTLADFWLRIN